MADETTWKDNLDLKQALKNYVGKNFKREEIVDFMKRDFPEYPWSVRTLARRLKTFEIGYIDVNVDIEVVKDAVQKELKGPGKNLGYRAMHLKLRAEHHLLVPRRLVADVMYDLDPEGVEERGLKRKRKKQKQPYVSHGPGWTYSLDGHDKLMGYQNSTFPIALYGCLDTFSRKIIFLKVWTSNSNPKIIGKFYMDFLLDSRKIPRFLTLDKGTETGLMGTMHVYLMDKFGNFEDPVNSVLFGPSTSNKIERWWKEIHERMEKFIKEQLRILLLNHDYDPLKDLDRKILAYVSIPVVQKESDIFVRGWNSHRVRQQKDVMLPAGIPDHLFSFPEKYNAEDQHTEVTNDALVEVGSLAELDQVEDDYLSEEERLMFSNILPHPQDIECKDLVDLVSFFCYVTLILKDFQN